MKEKSDTKKIYILLGHPDKEGNCGDFADAYEHGANEARHEIRRTNIGEISFDPILHKGYRAIQALEPDLIRVQENIKWADHLVIIYPVWWAGMPAILKGLFDRVWLPGFAYHFRKDSLLWDRLLHGKTAHVVVTMDNWPIVERILFGDITHEISRAILGFAGIHPVKISKLGKMKFLTPEKKVSRMEMVANWGRWGK